MDTEVGSVKILTVDVPDPMFRELEQMAETQSKQLGKKVTADQLAKEAIWSYIRHLRKRQKENLR